jgi:hypothetical protein
MSADPALIAALGQDGVWLFGAIRIALPGKTLRLIDGAGTLQIDGETYAGSDDEFGTIAALEDIADDMGDEAPELRFSLFPVDDVALATLCSPAMQGSEVRVIAGAVDPATMTLIGVPETVFLGEVDVVTLRSGEGDRRVDFAVTSAFDRLFEIDEGQRASAGFHKAAWPGELGLDFMTGTTEKLYWGSKPPAGSAATSGSASRFDEWQDFYRG